jgi:hypothetical protein
MKEALTWIDAPEAAPAARLLQMALEAASDISACTSVLNVSMSLTLIDATSATRSPAP